MTKLTEYEELDPFSKESVALQIAQRGELWWKAGKFAECTPAGGYGITCCRCGHEWLPRVRRPVYCPSCRTKYWDAPRENRQGLRPGTHAYSLTAAEYIEAGSGGPGNENRVEEMVAKKVAAAK